MAKQQGSRGSGHGNRCDLGTPEGGPLLDQGQKALLPCLSTGESTGVRAADFTD